MFSEIHAKSLFNYIFCILETGFAFQLIHMFWQKLKWKTCKIWITPVKLIPSNAIDPQTELGLSVGGSFFQGKELKIPID